jgi:hypothetical protein
MAQAAKMNKLILGWPLPRFYQVALVLIRLSKLGRKVGGEFVGAEDLAHLELDLALSIDCRPSV